MLRAVIFGAALSLAGEAMAAPGSETLTWNGQRATVSSGGDDTEARSYELTTTLALREAFPPQQRLRVFEPEDSLRLRSGSLLFDALFAMALQEARDSSVSRIADPQFGVESCECYETGRKWPYVWTRDTAYATHLGLALLGPVRSRNSLQFKLSEKRTGGGLEIVQDTGTGGSWPISTDRVVWALGAYETLHFLAEPERAAFRDQVLTALANTLASDRLAAFDPALGLYKGEQSFLDWREQTYPLWAREDPLAIGASYSLSTNAVHYAALSIAAKLSAEKSVAAAARGEGAPASELNTAAGRYEGQARDLRAAIERSFWNEQVGAYASVIYAQLNAGTAVERAPMRDLLGESLVVVLGIAAPERAARLVASYPATEAGSPVVWPQLKDRAIYHNRAIWPFVTAYSMRAAKLVRNAAAVEHGAATLVRGAALNLSNMENFEFLTLANWLADGGLSGPVVNSQRQLWSLGAYLSFVVGTVFGVEGASDGLRFEPGLTAGLRREYFARSGELTLKQLLYQGKKLDVTLRLPELRAGDEGFYRVMRAELNGKAAQLTLRAQDLRDGSNHLVIDLERGEGTRGTINLQADRSKMWAPREPAVKSLRRDGDRYVLDLGASGESGVTLGVYRNGELCAAGLSEGSWADVTAPIGEPVCYTVVAVQTSSGLASHHSRPACAWPEASTASYSAWNGQLVSSDGALREERHGRYHFRDWGSPGQELRIDHLQVTRDGRYALRVAYGKQGLLNTGITAVTKRVEVRDAASGKVMASGAVTMPHLEDWGTWGESSPLVAHLRAGRAYRVRIADFQNMSYFSHFAAYRGVGGASGALNRANVSGVELRRAP